MTQISFSHIPDPRFLELVWAEFFVSRNRGLTLQSHFPWIRVPTPSVVYGNILDGNDLLGGLAIKDCSHCLRSNGPKVAALGLVCVREDRRGGGVGTELILAALNRAAADQFKGLTLWTNKRTFYEKVGFVLDDRSLYGWVENPHGHHGVDPFNSDLSCAQIVRDELADVSIPPFAIKVTMIRDKHASCMVILDKSGPIVAQYSDQPDGVAALLNKVLPRNWRLNAYQNDPILESLSHLGMTLRMEPTNLQMWLSLDQFYTSKDLAKLSRFTVLDRI